MDNEGYLVGPNKSLYTRCNGLVVFTAFSFVFVRGFRADLAIAHGSQNEAFPSFWSAILITFTIFIDFAIVLNAALVGHHAMDRIIAWCDPIY